MKDILLVGIGGGIGSMLRYAVSRLSVRYISSEWTMLGTFIVNIIGCFLIGLIAGWLFSNVEKFPGLSLLLITGFCGGYTTFSAFAFENVQLLQSGQILSSAIYILSSITFGLLAVWGGVKLI